jgi:hypothetical protein
VATIALPEFAGLISLLWGLFRSAKIDGIEPPRLVALHSKSILMKLASIVADYREFIRRETSSLQMGMTD